MEVTRIGYAEARPWVLRAHYAHRMPTVSRSWGLWDGHALIGVLTMGPPASPWLCKGVCGEAYRERVIELNRLVIKAGTPNGASRLVGAALRDLGREGDWIVVSYADTKWHHVGYVYQASNFVYTGATKERTDMFANGKHSRHNLGDPSQRQDRSAKHRYVYFVGTRRFTKEARAALRYAEQAYPKGNADRYEPGRVGETQQRLFAT